MYSSADCQRLLPLEFCDGYIKAYRYRVSAGPAVANISIGRETINYPDRSGFWKLMSPYINLSPDGHEPLPYLFVATPLIGFLKHEYKPQDDNKWKVKILREIGVLWWEGISKESIMSFTSLSKLLSPSIVTVLNSAIDPPRGLAVLALSTFIEEFQCQSEIPCAWGVTDMQLWIELKVCPFCIGMDVPCTILLGVVEGFMKWLQDSSFSFQPAIQINLEHTTYHRIVFDIV
jgi:hypothetical protein